MKNLKGRGRFQIRWRFVEGRRSRAVWIDGATEAAELAGRVRDVSVGSGSVRRLI